MRYRIIHFNSIVLLAAIVALSGIGASAQSANEAREEFADAVITLSAGQTLRLSVANPLPAIGNDSRKFKMLVAPLIIDISGRVIATSDEIALDPGEFHFFDFGHRCASC